MKHSEKKAGKVPAKAAKGKKSVPLSVKVEAKAVKIAIKSEKKNGVDSSEGVGHPFRCRTFSMLPVVVLHFLTWLHHHHHHHHHHRRQQQQQQQLRYHHHILSSSTEEDP